jgi:hypothetical protein
MTRQLDTGREGQVKRSLLEVAIARAGIVKGAQATEVVVTWAIAQNRLGHPLGETDTGSLSAAIREYAAYWKMSERSAWNKLKLFKRAFPNEESPARLASLVSEAVDERQARAAVASLQLAF